MRRKNNDNFLIILSLILSSIVLFYLYNVNNLNNDVIIINNNIPTQKENKYDNSDTNSGPGRKYFSKRINLRTRGEPDNYQTVGILKKEGTDDVVPLIGRQTYPGSNHWNYFTMTDSHLKTEIPIKKEKDCTGIHGCSEIQTNDTIDLLNNNYEVEMYPYNELRYIP